MVSKMSMGRRCKMKESRRANQWSSSRGMRHCTHSLQRQARKTVTVSSVWKGGGVTYVAAVEKHTWLVSLVQLISRSGKV